MSSEHIQRRIEQLLDDADAAVANDDWELVRQGANAALSFDPDNEDVRACLAAAERNLETEASTADAEAASTPSCLAAAPQPTSFAGGRYQVREFLGEDSKRRVYPAHDELLDRDVAFALIKTDASTTSVASASPKSSAIAPKARACRG